MGIMTSFMNAFIRKEQDRIAIPLNIIPVNIRDSKSTHSNSVDYVGLAHFQGSTRGETNKVQNEG